jgi:hypothetical protein
MKWPSNVSFGGVCLAPYPLQDGRDLVQSEVVFRVPERGRTVVRPDVRICVSPEKNTHEVRVASVDRPVQRRHAEVIQRVDGMALGDQTFDCRIIAALYSLVERVEVHQFHHAHRRIRDCSRSASLSVSFIVGHVAESQVVERICRITRPTRSQGDRKGRLGSIRPGALGI